MPTILENYTKWNETYNWKYAGEEWSRDWGNSNLQWYISIYPRIAKFLPNNRVLEIAPGFGRWTKYLAPLCNELTVVDLAPKCIEFCKKRFKDNNNIKYYINDGKSFEQIADSSIDFVFTYDSLVHAEMAVLENYITELYRILSSTGVAFLHHSNLAVYSHIMYKKGISRKFQSAIFHLRFKKPLKDMKRAHSVDGEKIAQFALKKGFCSIKQELINWRNPKDYLIDCFSILEKKPTNKDQKINRINNPHFMQEANIAKNIFSHYN